MEVFSVIVNTRWNLWTTANVKIEGTDYEISDGFGEGLITWLTVMRKSIDQTQDILECIINGSI